MDKPKKKWTPKPGTLTINRAPRRWTLHPKYTPTSRPCERWPIGTLATMFNCYGRNPTTGRVVAHSPQGHSLTIQTPDGWLSGGVELLEVKDDEKT